MDMNSTPLEIAREIFHDFELNQSCTISGMIIDDHIEAVRAKGEIVCELLRQLDVEFNYSQAKGDKTPRRKRVMLPNTIGGFVAQKIFRYKSEKRGDYIVYVIQRIQ